MMRRPFGLFFIIFVITCVLVSACNAGKSNEVTPSLVPAIDLPSPTPTATPQPGRVALIAPLSLDAGYVNKVQAQITDLVHTSGMIMDFREGLEAGDISEDWKIVVLLTTPVNLSELLAAAPGVQFVVVDAVGIQETQNLSLIRGYPDRQAFVAGYVTALVSPDWRSMALLPADEPYGTIIQEAYLNGVRYLCGRCSPVYSPIVPFPQWVAMPSGTDAASWQAQADQLMLNIVYASYITPEAASPELLKYLADRGLVLVGSKTPPEEVRPRWAATVQQDLLSPFITLWPGLVAGEGSRSVDAEMMLEDINPQFLSPGRQQAAEYIIQQMQQGWISPLTYSQPLQ